MSQYEVTIRKLVFSADPAGYFLETSSTVPAENLATNQPRASRSRGSLRNSYSRNIRFAWSCVTPLMRFLRVQVASASRLIRGERTCTLLRVAEQQFLLRCNRDFL